MKRTWWLVLAAALLLAIIGGAYALAPYSAVKGALDGITPDGNFERLSAAAYAASRPWIGGLGALGLAVAAFFLLARERSQALVEAALEGLAAYWHGLRADTRSYFADLWDKRPRGGELAALLGIVALGAVLRALLLDHPLGHDEAYTFVAFVSRELRHAVGDYHLPNNHVFHSLLAWISIRVFGEAPWALRLPAYLAGVALIPVAYAAGRLAFNRTAGLAAAGLVAVNMHLISHSTDARGYSLVALFSALIWVFAMQLLRGPNRFTWLLLSVAAALGMWTIPTMLYPYGGIMLWMVLCWMLQDRGWGYHTPQFLRDLIGSGLTTFVLMMLLYTPVFLNWGVRAVFDNDLVAVLYNETWSEFFQNIGARWGDTWLAWNEGLWPALIWLSLVGFLVAILRNKGILGWWLPLPLVLLAFVFGVMTVQRVVGWVRVWSFAAPIYLVYAGVGLSYVLGRLKRWLQPRWQPAAALALVGLYAVSIGSWIYRPGDAAAIQRGALGGVEAASLFLQERVGDDDLIAVISPDNPAFRYYTRQLGLPEELFDAERPNLDQAYVVLNTLSQHTVERVMQAQDDLLDHVDLGEAEILYTNQGLEIYLLPIH